MALCILKLLSTIKMVNTIKAVYINTTKVVQIYINTSNKFPLKKQQTNTNKLVRKDPQNLLKADEKKLV